MRPDISIIIPVFNVKNYLGATLESVLLQDFQSFEILVVDDSSTDDTKKIAERYASLDSRIQVLTNTGAKGIAGARNTALAQMRGKTCFFLDGDDLLFPEALSTLYFLMERSGAPMVRGVAAMFCFQRWLFFPGHEDMPEGAVAMQTSAHPTSGFWTHLYDSGFLKEKGITFPEHIGIGQDGPFLCHAYSLADSIPLINRNILVYRINHKQAKPSGANALSAINYFLLAREHFDNAGRHHLTAPYLESKFRHQWLNRIHAALEESEETALSFMEKCAALLHDMEHEAGPFLDTQLGYASGAFWASCREKDAAGMLDAVKNAGLLRPQTPYMGITRRAEGPGWLWYKFSRRLANVTRDHRSRNMLLFFKKLHEQSAARLARRTA